MAYFMSDVFEGRTTQKQPALEKSFFLGKMRRLFSNLPPHFAATSPLAPRFYLGVPIPRVLPLAPQHLACAPRNKEHKIFILFPKISNFAEKRKQSGLSDF
jgi:hypothetical protein